MTIPSGQNITHIILALLQGTPLFRTRFPSIHNLIIPVHITGEIVGYYV